MTTKITTAQAKEIGMRLNIDFDQSECEYDLREFTMGLNEELEHKDVTGGDMLTTGRIALAHLKENPQYYTKLKSVMKAYPPTVIDRLRAEKCPKCGSSNNEMMIEGHKVEYLCADCNKHWSKPAPLRELQKDVDSIKDEAEPMKPKTKLQTKVLGNIEHFLEKNNSSLENKISMGGTVLLNEKSADWSQSSNKTINNIKMTANNLHKSVIAENFIKEYRTIVAMDNKVPEMRINKAYELALEIQQQDIMLNKSNNVENGWDRDGISLMSAACDSIAEKILYIDMVATKMHDSGQWPILNTLAEMRCTKCKHCTLEDNGIMNVKNIEKHMICKGKMFDKSKSYWTLMVQAIKHGVASLTDEQLVLLREFIYSRM